DLVGQIGVAVAVHLGLGVRRDLDRPARDRQRVAGVGHVVVAQLVVGIGQRCTDVVAADRACGVSRGAVAGGDVVAVLDAVDVTSQRRVGIAVGLCLRIGNDRQRGLGDAQVGALVGQAVVAAQSERPLLDGVGAD